MSDIISSMITCLETSNKLLNTYQEETAPGLKKDLIEKMINTNATAIIAAIDHQGEEQQMLAEVDEYIGQFVAIPIDNYNLLIEELKHLKQHSKDCHLPSFRVGIDICLDNLKIE